jgi:hypothetical protein
MISMQLSGSVSLAGGSPAACVPQTRRRSAWPAPLFSAMPSIATRSKGG